MATTEQSAKPDDYKADRSLRETGKYGWCGFTPMWLQWLNKIQCHVLTQCIFNFFEGFMVNGVINVVLVALEKRYSLSSSKSGLIASSNDFGAVACVMFVGYFGEHRHKPRLMGMGILLMSLGCLVFSLPQFAGDQYDYVVSGSGPENTTNMCSGANNSSCSDGDTGTLISNNTLYYSLLLLGNILLGIGASPMFTIGLSYIDENCKPKLSSFYISWTFCAAAIGVAVGYVIGGQTLSLFVDIDKVDTGSVNLTPASPQWVGAWWIGALVAMAALFLVAFPILGFPRRLPSYDEVQKYRKSEAHGGLDESATRPDFGKNIKDFPKAVFLLIRNPTYVFITLGATAEALIIGGMATFGAKMIQEKFNVDLTTAGTIMGIITIPGSGGGMLLGGYLVKRLKLKCRGIVRMCAAFMFTGLLIGPFLLAHCASDPLAGVTTPYWNSSTISGLITDCNSDCGCTTRGFEPVCADGAIYFTPCHAGCSETKNESDTYSSCSCLGTTQSTGPDNSSFSETLFTSEAKAGLCTGRCDWLYVFCAMFLVAMIITFATMSPGVAALFRCVPDKQRSLAIAVNLLFVRLVGTTPGPILLGAIIDSSCILWQDTCGAQGSCWVYNKSDMGVRSLIWFLGLKAMGVLFFMTASFVYKPPPGSETDKDLSSAIPPAIKSMTEKTDRDNTEGEFTRF